MLLNPLYVDMNSNVNSSALLEAAKGGDINAFQKLYSNYQEQLKSYLYRLLANRNDAEDLAHDTFIKAFDNIKHFRGNASIKTWIFQIGTNLAYNHLKRRSRWSTDVLEKAKQLVLNDKPLADEIISVALHSPEGNYDIKEHIDTCFTCMGKTLLIENQITLILKDVYAFSIHDIMQILDETEGTVKYLLQTARKTMREIFDKKCSLINKQGTCHQCSELNGWFNPRQNQQEALLKLDLVKGSQKFDREKLYKMRVSLVRAIDPLRSKGNHLQEVLLNCNQMAMEER